MGLFSHLRKRARGLFNHAKHKLRHGLRKFGQHIHMAAHQLVGNIKQIAHQPGRLLREGKHIVIHAERTAVRAVSRAARTSVQAIVHTLVKGEQEAKKIIDRGITGAEREFKSISKAVSGIAASFQEGFRTRNPSTKKPANIFGIPLQTLLYVGGAGGAFFVLMQIT